MQDAATSLRVGVTTLKKVCRLHGIRRWPYRRRSFIHKLTQQAEMRHGRAAIAAAERVREVSGSLGPAAPAIQLQVLQLQVLFHARVSGASRVVLLPAGWRWAPCGTAALAMKLRVPEL